MKLIIFDLDNTLVHSHIDYAAMRIAVADLLRAHNVTQENDRQLEPYSVGEMIARGKAYREEIAALAWQKVLEFEREGRAKSTVDDDVAQTLKVLLEQNAKLAILTNNAHAAAVEVLEKFELLNYFEMILSRDDVPMKPDPSGILKAKSTFEAQHVFHVGDAWLDGVAANRADVPFIAFQPLPEAFTGRGIRVWNTVQTLSEIPMAIANYEL